MYPGFKHVSEFGPDSEYASDEEEEVEYVVFDLENVDRAVLSSSDSYRLIAMDTPTPFLQLSGTIMKGKHESLLGTQLIFEEGKEPHTEDRSRRPLTYFASTEKRVTFHQVTLKPKVTPDDSNTADQDKDASAAVSSLNELSLGPDVPSKAETSAAGSNSMDVDVPIPAQATSTSTGRKSNFHSVARMTGAEPPLPRRPRRKKTSVAEGEANPITKGDEAVVIEEDTVEKEKGKGKEKEKGKETEKEKKPKRKYTRKRKALDGGDGDYGRADGDGRKDDDGLSYAKGVIA